MNELEAKDVVSYLEEIAPKNLGIEGDQIGMVFGSPNTKVNGIGITWMATLPVLKEAVAKKINMLLVHERLFFPYQESSKWYNDIPEENKEVNKNLREILEENNMVVYRSHSNWDALSKHGVMDSLASELGYDKVIAKTKFVKTYEIPPQKLSNLAQDIKHKLNLDFVTVYGDQDSLVERVTPLIGGFGGNQIGMPEIAKSHSSQAIIVGDLIEYILIHAQELGINVIQTVHSISEIPGIKNQYELIRKKFPKTPVFYFDSGSQYFKSFKPRIV